MKRMFQSFIFLLFVLCGSGRAHAQYMLTDFQPLHGLSGSWKMVTKKGALYERWFTVSDTVLQNKSYRVNGSDTIPQETVELKLSKGSITYSSTVANQNNQLPVPFTLVTINNGKYVFENRAHDFPQEIIYHLVDKNTLNASIRGTAKDKYREMVFNFKREE